MGGGQLYSKRVKSHLYNPGSWNSVYGPNPIINQFYRQQGKGSYPSWENKPKPSLPAELGLSLANVFQIMWYLIIEQIMMFMWPLSQGFCHTRPKWEVKRCRILEPEWHSVQYNLPFSNVKNCHTVTLSNYLGRQVKILNWEQSRGISCNIRNK